MTISTYANLQTEVANWLDRTDLTAEIKDFIVLTESKLRSNVRTREMEKSTTVDTVAGTETVSLPSTFTGMREVYITGSPKRVLRNVALDYLHTRHASGTTGKPDMYAISGSSIYLAAVPDSAYTLNLSYYGFDPLSDSNTTNWVLDSYPDVYLLGAMAEAGGFLMNPTLSQYWKSRFDEALYMMIESDKGERYGNDLRARPFGFSVV